MTAVNLLSLDRVLAELPDRIVACSGGVDSLVLATLAHRQRPNSTVVAHAATPAVPEEATARVVRYAEELGWRLEVVRPREFADERYLENPTDRCYWCKSHLYDAVAAIDGADLASVAHGAEATVVSGTNVDDLGEYRPGLEAAAERNVRHPFVEAGWTKADIRAAAQELGLDAADLPASPCLASRLYTGTRVSVDRLRAVEVGEQTVTALTGIAVVRCRIRESSVLIEVAEEHRGLITAEVLGRVGQAMQAVVPGLASPELDDRPYRPGRAFVVTSDAHP